MPLIAGQIVVQLRLIGQMEGAGQSQSENVTSAGRKTRALLNAYRVVGTRPRATQPSRRVALEPAAPEEQAPRVVTPGDPSTAGGARTANTDIN